MAAWFNLRGSPSTYKAWERMILDRYYEFGDPEKARDVLQKGFNLLTTFGGDSHKLLTLEIRKLFASF